MNIDFSAILYDLEGNPIKKDIEEVDPDGKLVKPATIATLGTLAVEALLAQFRDETSLSAIEKVRRFRLAESICNASSIDIPIEDIALIKQLIGKAYPPLLVGRAFQIIEG